jgi:hypothetical protein
MKVICTSGTGNARVSSLSNPFTPYSDSLTAQGARVDVGVRKRERHATLSISVFGASLGYLFAALTSTVVMIMIIMKSHNNPNTT